MGSIWVISFEQAIFGRIYRILITFTTATQTKKSQTFVYELIHSFFGWKYIKEEVHTGEKNVLEENSNVDNDGKDFVIKTILLQNKNERKMFRILCSRSSLFVHLIYIMYFAMEMTFSTNFTLNCYSETSLM